MLKTALLPSLPAAVRGRVSCGPQEVHTRWNGKSAENKTRSHKLSWCLEKCSQNGSLPWRQTGFCSGNKSGPQLNDKPSFLLVTRLVDGAFPGEALCWGARDITTTLQTRRTEERCFSHCQFCRAAWGSHWESSDPQPDECLPTSRSLPGPRHTSNVLSCFQLSSQTHGVCLSLPVPSDPSASPPQCWTPRSGHRHATKPLIPKKGQIPALAVVHPKEQMLLLPRNPSGT